MGGLGVGGWVGGNTHPVGGWVAQWVGGLLSCRVMGSMQDLESQTAQYFSAHQDLEHFVTS